MKIDGQYMDSTIYPNNSIHPKELGVLHAKGIFFPLDFLSSSSSDPQPFHIRLTQWKVDTNLDLKIEQFETIQQL